MSRTGTLSIRMLYRGFWLYPDDALDGTCARLDPEEAGTSRSAFGRGRWDIAAAHWELTPLSLHR